MGVHFFFAWAFLPPLNVLLWCSLCCLFFATWWSFFVSIFSSWWCIPIRCLYVCVIVLMARIISCVHGRVVSISFFHFVLWFSLWLVLSRLPWCGKTSRPPTPSSPPSPRRSTPRSPASWRPRVSRRRLSRWVQEVGNLLKNKMKTKKRRQHGHRPHSALV